MQIAKPHSKDSKGKGHSTPPARYQMDCEDCISACCNSPSSSLTAADCGCLTTCGPCNFCRKPWVVTPQEFETPTAGNFNVSIQVPHLPGMHHYTIDEVQVTITSMGLDTSSWKIKLISPHSGGVILKHLTTNGGDLDGTFSDSPCVGCVSPFEALSAFEGTSALGKWTLVIKAADSGRDGFVSWVGLEFRMNCVAWDFDPDVNFSNITQNTTYNNTPADVTFNNTPPASYQMDCAHCTSTCCNSPSSSLAAADCGCLTTCGPCNFCRKPWVVTPQEFDTPTAGSFNVSIQVPHLPGMQHYTIDEVHVKITSMGLDTSSWKIKLISPHSGGVILKHLTTNGGDLDGTFSDSPCVGCVSPFEALSAFEGTSALGKWTLVIKATDSGRHGFVSWVSIELRMNCVNWDFDPDVNFSNITQNTTYNNTPADVTFNNTPPASYQMDCAHCTSTCCNSPSSSLAAADCGCLTTCGPCDFCQKPWVLTPEHFETPTAGDFNVSIQVPHLPGMQHYTIDEVQLTITSMGLDTSSWKIDLIGPDLGDVILKEYTVNGGDLDSTFSDSPCVGCVSPFEALSAFEGTSALGSWTVAIKGAADSGRHGFISWISLAVRMNC